MRSGLTESRPSEGTGVRSSYAASHVEFRPAPAYPAHPPFQHHAPRKAKRGWSLSPSEGWFALLVLAVAAYSVSYSMIAAGWISNSTVLLWSTLAGMIVGFLVAKVRSFPQVILHVAACLLGHWLSVWLTSVVAYHVSWLLLLGDLRNVILGGFSASNSVGSDMAFLFYLTFLCYFLAYFGAWLVYRPHLPWLVALVYCSIMLVNLNYATKQDFTLLVVVLLSSLLLLIARVQLVNQLEEWMQEGLHTDRIWLQNLTRRFNLIASLFVVIILPLSLMLPIIQQPQAGTTFWNALDNAWSNITHGRFSLSGPATIFQPYQAASNFFGDSLSITGNVNLPNGEVLTYTVTGTSQPQYLQGFTFDHFDGHTWTSNASNVSQAYPRDTPLPDETSGNYKQIITSVTIELPPGGSKPYIFAPAQPGSFSVPTLIYGNGLATMWTQQGPLTAKESYDAVSNVLTASPQELSTVPLPQDVPSYWSNDPNYPIMQTYYLQVPANLSPTVLKTMQQWTQGATNTYDAMRMLEQHLSDRTQFTYSVTNPPVPNNVDAVSWLLQTRQGYCTYYATAMTIMARLMGVPSRIVNGFNQGQYDPGRKVWAVDGENAHSWVQVYFPGQGWVNFDPTPGFSLTGSANTHPAPTATTKPTTHPKPSPTAGNRRPGAQPTAATGHNGANNGGVSPDATTREMFFLGGSLVVLFISILLLLFAIYRNRQMAQYAGVSPVSALFWRVTRLASLTGAPPQPSQTPYEYARQLARRYPQVAMPLRRIADLFVRERWAAPHQAPHPAEQQQLEQVWPQLRNTFIREWFRRKRS